MFKDIDGLFKTSITLACWAILFLVVIYIIRFFNDLFVILAVSLAIAYVLLWPVKVIERYLPETKKVSKRFIATLTTYVLSIITLAIIVTLIIQPVSRQLIELFQVLPKYIVELENYSTKYMDKLSSQYGLTFTIKDPETESTSVSPDNLLTKEEKKASASIIEENFYKQLQNLANYGIQALQNAVLGTVRNVIYVVLILMLSFFFLIGAGQIQQWFKRLINPQHHEQFNRIVTRINDALSGYVRGQAIIGLITGLFMLGIYTLFEIKYAFLLALFAGLGQFIPILGHALAIIPAVIIALVKNPLAAVFILAIFLVFMVFSNNVLTPKILGDMTGVSPIIVIIALIIGERIAGLIGILIAVPVASIIQILFIELYLPLTKKDLQESTSSENTTS